MTNINAKITGIVEALKSESVFDVRLTHGNRWMFWENLNREWVVLEKKYRQRGYTEVYRGRDEGEAVNALIGEC